jgi:hypothetical protein
MVGKSECRTCSLQRIVSSRHKSTLSASMQKTEGRRHETAISLPQYIPLYYTCPRCCLEHVSGGVTRSVFRPVQKGAHAPVEDDFSGFVLQKPSATLSRSLLQPCFDPSRRHASGGRAVLTDGVSNPQPISPSIAPMPCRASLTLTRSSACQNLWHCTRSSRTELSSCCKTRF